jgi:hypothetical protein
MFHTTAREKTYCLKNLGRRTDLFQVEDTLDGSFFTYGGRAFGVAYYAI